MRDKLWSKNFINACIANFLMASSFHLLMPTIPVYLTQNLHISESKVGAVMSTYSLGMLLIRPFSGYIVDVFDRKRVLFLSLFLFVLSVFGYIWASTIALMMLVRFVHGIFWGMSTVSSNTVAIDIIPPRRRAEGIGFFGMNMNLAMAIAPFFAMNIFDQWGFSWIITASILMGFVALISVTGITTIPREKQTEIPKLSVDRFILVKGIPILLNQLMVTIGWGMLLAFAVLYGKEIGITNAGIFFLFVAAGLIISRITSGRFVDRGHLHLVSILALSIISVSFLAFAFLHSIYAYCITAFFIGTGFGTMLPAFQTAFINMAPHDRRGTANSTYLTGFDLGVGLGMLIGGFIASHYSLSHLYLVASISAFFAVFVYMFVSKRVYEKHKLR